MLNSLEHLFWEMQFPREDRTLPALQKQPGWHDPTGQAVPRVSQVIWQVGPQVRYSSNGGQTEFLLLPSCSSSSSIKPSSSSRSRITFSSVSSNLDVLEQIIGSASVASSSSGPAATAAQRITPIKNTRLPSIMPRLIRANLGLSVKMTLIYTDSPTNSRHRLRLALCAFWVKILQRLPLRMRFENLLL